MRWANNKGAKCRLGRLCGGKTGKGMLEGEGAVEIYSGDVRKFAVLKRKTFPLPREGKKNVVE